MNGLYVYLMLFTLLILLPVAYFLFDKDIVSPSVMTLSLFTLSFICFVYNVNYWQVVFTFKAYSLFTLSFLLMILTEWFVSHSNLRLTFSDSRTFHIGRPKKRVTQLLWGRIEKSFFIDPLWNFLITAFVLFATILYVHRVYAMGASLGGEGLYAFGRAKEEGNYDAFSRLLFNLIRFINYAYALILAQNWFLFHRRKLTYSSLSACAILLCGALCQYVSSQRSTFITYVIGIVVIMLVAIYDAHNGRKNVDPGKIFAPVCAVAALLMLIFFISRGAVKGTTASSSFMQYMTYYFGSTSCLMGRIVENPDLCHEPFVGYFGEKTFFGLYVALYQGGFIHEAPASRKWIGMGGHTSSRSAGNEFTFFCGPYVDFGFWGTLVFMVTLYAVFSFIYYHCILSRKPSLKRCIVMIMYSYLYSIIAMSFFQDTTATHTRPITVAYYIFTTIFVRVFFRARYKRVPRSSGKRNAVSSAY